MSQWQLLHGHAPVQGAESLLDVGHRVFCIERDQAAQASLALHWAQYESAMNAYPAPAPAWSLQSGESLISRYQIQCHYLFNHCFVTRDALLLPEALNKIDLTLIHGEQDALCPVNNSIAIHQLAQGSRLIRLPDSGHELATQSMQQALLGAVASW